MKQTVFFYIHELLLEKFRIRDSLCLSCMAIKEACELKLACSTGGNMLGTENLVSTLGENQLILQTGDGVKLLS